MKQQILLVDDNPGDAELLSLVFSERDDGIVLVHVGDGSKAAALLVKAAASPCVPFGLVVLDLNLPRINGLELLTMIKQDPRLKNLPTVIFTSSDRRQDREQAQQAQANGFLIKPSDYPGYVAAAVTLAGYLRPDGEAAASCAK